MLGTHLLAYSISSSSCPGLGGPAQMTVTMQCPQLCNQSRTHIAKRQQTVGMAHDGESQEGHMLLNLGYQIVSLPKPAH